MPKIDLCFSGWLRGVEITKAMDVATVTDVSVANMSAKELVEALKSGKLAISLSECLKANHADDHIELFDYDPQWDYVTGEANPLTELADAAFRQAAGKVQEKAVQSRTPLIVAEDGLEDNEPGKGE